MTRSAEDRPASVPQAQQAGEILSRWRWVEPTAWTVRMLATLEQGIEGGKWFRLFDNVISERNLFAAFQQVASNRGSAGVDHITVSDFERALPESLWEVADQLKHGGYRPQSIRRVHIPKPGTNETRPLGIPTVRDRMVQAAVVNVIEPIFERDFADQSYGFRPGRGCKDALCRVDELIQAGHVYVVDADLKGYFDTIPHDRLLSRLKEKIADGSVLSLIETFLKAKILDGPEELTPSMGAPQGAVLSPLLSNIYLDPLDHMMAQTGLEMVRYAGDFVILCQTAEEAAHALALVEAWVTENELQLHPTKTKVVDVRTEGFDFLGYHFRGWRYRPRKQSVTKLKTKIRHKTPRTNGNSLPAIIADLNRMLRGWFEYFQHGRLRLYSRLDGWIRRRLRRILMSRNKLRGQALGKANARWPDAYFDERGLYSLARAYSSPANPL